MEILKIGSRGDEVKNLQVLLERNGYELNIDGIFGNTTEDMVMDFQRKNFIDPDGVVAKITWDALHSRGNLSHHKQINDTKYILPSHKYYNQPQAKKNIVLHHTNGWTVVKGTNDKPSMNHFNWWASTKGHVSTAYSIDYKGNIYEHFDPSYWAYHLGLGTKYDYLDKQSIGIELVNEGHMIKKDNKFYWVMGDTDTILPYNRPKDEPVHVKNGWRGHYYFAPYSKEQFESTLFLVDWLCKRFNIIKKFIDNCEYNENLLSGEYEGIYTHTNVRKYPEKYNKWDLSPAFNFSEFKRRL